MLFCKGRNQRTTEKYKSFLFSQIVISEEKKLWYLYFVDLNYFVWFSFVTYLRIDKSTIIKGKSKKMNTIDFNIPYRDHRSYYRRNTWYIYFFCDRIQQDDFSLCKGCFFFSGLTIYLLISSLQYIYAKTKRQSWARSKKSFFFKYYSSVKFS